MPPIQPFRELHFFKICLASSFTDFWRGWVFPISIWMQCPGKRCSASIRDPPSPAWKHTSSLQNACPLPGLEVGAQSTQQEDTAGVHLPLSHHPSVSTPEAPHATEVRLSPCGLAMNRDSLKLISYLLSLQTSLYREICYCDKENAGKIWVLAGSGPSVLPGILIGVTPNSDYLWSRDVRNTSL